jgi:hypothetical protein
MYQELLTRSSIKYDSLSIVVRYLFVCDQGNRGISCPYSMYGYHCIPIQWLRGWIKFFQHSFVLSELRVWNIRILNLLWHFFSFRKFLFVCDQGNRGYRLLYCFIGWLSSQYPSYGREKDQYPLLRLAWKENIESFGLESWLHYYNQSRKWLKHQPSRLNSSCVVDRPAYWLFIRHVHWSFNIMG